MYTPIVCQTLMRGAQRRGLKAGASNTKTKKSEVTFVLSGDAAKVQEMVDFLTSGSVFVSRNIVAQVLQKI